MSVQIRNVRGTQFFATLKRKKNILTKKLRIETFRLMEIQTSGVAGRVGTHGVTIFG